VLGVYHEIVTQKESGELLEDKIFFMVTGENPKGTLTEEFEGGHNEWLTIDELAAKGKVFGEQELKNSILAGEQWLIEHAAEYSKQVF
jgi:hypothetical protein